MSYAKSNVANEIATNPTDNYLTAGTSTMDIGGAQNYSTGKFSAYITLRGQYGTQPANFRQLMQEWKKETMGVSSVSVIVMNPSYQRIIGMGERVVPDILRDLQQNGGQWFHALSSIAGRDVAAGCKTVSDARDAWILWGYQNNYI